MGSVTGIVESPRKDGRFVVVVDGNPFATVSLDIIERLELRVGVALDETRAAAVEEAGAALRTYDRALNLLAFQSRSARDLRRRLMQKGEPAAHVDAALARLVELGVLDDAQFARQLARSKLLGQGASKRRLQQELFKRGVDRTLADEAIAEVITDEGVDEGEAVERLARKKLRSLEKLDAPTRRRRLYAFLARRGYDGDVIRRAMRSVLDVADDADEGGLDDGD